MTRRYQVRARTCNMMLLAFALLVIVALQLIFGRRAPSVVERPTPTPSATLYANRQELAFLPTNTPYITYKTLPTHTSTPTVTPTPTRTPTPSATPTATPTPGPTVAARVSVELANVRSGPGTEYDLLASLDQNASVTLTGKSSDAVWVTVQLDSGLSGWILTQLLAVDGDTNDLIEIAAPPTPTATVPPPAIVSAEYINLRTGPDIVYDIIEELPQNTVLQPLGRNETGEWLFVKAEDGEEGWLFVALLTVNVEIGELPVAEAPPTPTPTPTPETLALAAAVAPGAARLPRIVLANYFTWFDNSSWDACNISAGDKPLQRYLSDDPAAIARHVRMAADSGIDGFTAQWAAPGDRTDRNFAALLQQSQNVNFHSTVVFLRHIWPGATQGNTVDAIRYLQERYGGHPNFLKINSRPVIFFTDLPRIPRAAGQSAQEAWAGVRAQVDPDKRFWWIAEGLDPSYLRVFDGLWVYKVSHAAYPNDYVKASAWAQRVRSWEQRTGEPKLWVGTVMPGWDDRNAGCRPDIRVPSQPFVKSRDGGNFYRATYNAAVNSNPDILWIHSFNEWVEGSYIEPSQQYGDTYLNLTKVLAGQFKGG